MGNLFVDYRYSAESLRQGLFRRMAWTWHVQVEHVFEAVLTPEQLKDLQNKWFECSPTWQKGLLLGNGSIYNHSAEPNLGYRRVRVDRSSEAAQGLSVSWS